MSTHERERIHSATKGRPCPMCGLYGESHRVGSGGLVLHRLDGNEPAVGAERDGWVYMGPTDNREWSQWRRADDPQLKQNQTNAHYTGRAKAGLANTPIPSFKLSPKPVPNGTHTASTPTAAHTDTTVAPIPAAPADPAAEVAKILANRLTAFRERSTAEQRASLATHLDLPPHALECVEGVLAWHCGRKCWMLPSYSPKGDMVGIDLRYADGRKETDARCQRMLAMPPADQWDAGGDIYVVEGWSDVLALRALRLTAIGRPSNSGGLDPLAEFLARNAAGRTVYVMGERDEKPDGRWPGRAAEPLAFRLAAKISDVCRVRWALPPDESTKDARAWVHAQGIGPGSTREECETAGRIWAAQVETLAMTPAPPAGATAGAGASAAAPARPSWTWLTMADLLARPRTLDYLIRGVMVARQPCVLGGAFKTLKTSVMLDAAVSLASGTPFLGHMAVPQAVPVAVVSGESGETTIRDTVERICLARGVSPGGLPLHFLFEMPQLCDAGHVEAVAEQVRATGARVLVYDPLYLGLLSGGDARAAANVYAMGPLLLGISRACLAAGCTPVLVHHTVTVRESQGKIPELADLAFAGVKEYARQWVLLGRRERYEEGTGTHRLWLTVGGSAGHSGLWAVDVEEGVVRDDLSGRTWDVTVRAGSEERRKRESEREQERADARLQRWAEQESQVMAALDRLDPEGRGAGREQVRQLCGIRRETYAEAVTRLVERGVLRPLPVAVTAGKGASRQVQGIARARDDDQQ